MKRMLSVLLMAVCATLVSAKQPQLPTSYNFQRGIEAIDNGNQEEGEKYLLKEIEDNPKNGYAYAWLSSIEYDRDEIGNAITTLQLALKYLPKSDKFYIAWCYSSLGKIYLELDDHQQGLHYLSAAVKTEPTNTSWLDDRGYAYIYLQQYDQAIQDGRTIIKLEPGSTMGYLLAAKAYYRMEDYQQALQLYQQANRLAERGYTHAYLAMTENQLHNYEQAADHVIQAFSIKHYQENAWDLFNRQNAQLLDELLPRIKVQIAKHPNSIEWKFYLLAIYRINDQYEQAIQLIQEIQKLDSDPYYDYILSDLYHDMGDQTTALQEAQQAYQADTAETDYLYQQLRIYEELNQMQEAMQIAEQLVQINPDRGASYTTRADLHFEMHQYDKAAEDYSTSLAINSSGHYNRFKRGYSYLLQGDTTKATKDFERLVKEASGEIEQLFAYIHLGQTEKAYQVADSLLQADTTFHSERYNLACAYSLLGDTAKAFDLLEQELEDGYILFRHIRNDVDLINLHGPRFDQLLEKYEQKMQQRIQNFQAPTSPDTTEERIVEVPFTASGGVTKVDCTINELPLSFIFDTGASDVTISKVEADFMYKNGYLTERDIVGRKAYQVATGAVAVGTTIILKEIKFGGLVLNDVRASVVESQNAPLLLGQSVLKRLGKIEIDNLNRVLKITTSK